MGTIIKRLFSSQLRINMVSGVVTSVVSMAVLATGYPIYLHFLGYEQYGVWLVLASVLTFAQLGSLGIGPAVVKLVAEEHGRSDLLGIRHYIATAFVLLCVSGTAVLTIILTLKRQIITLFALSSENTQIALWLLPYIGVLSIYVLIVQMFEATLSGLGRMDLVNYRGLLARFTNLCVSTGLLCLGFGIRSLLIGRAVAELITHLAVFLCIRGMVGFRIFEIQHFDIYRCKRLLGFGGTILGSSVLNMLFSPLNKLVLSRYVGVASVPVYEMALMGGMQIRGLVAASHRALVPEISRVSAEMTVQAKNRIVQLYRRSLELVILLGTPVCALSAILAPVLLKLWLGDKFVETLPGVFRIILLGILVSALGIPASCTLIGTGHIRHNLMANVVLTVTNIVVVLCILAVLQVTVAAMAWCSSVAMAAATLYLIVQERRVLRDLAVP